MRIRQPWMIKTLSLLGYMALRTLLATVRCKYWRSGPDLRPCAVEHDKHYIYAIWHEYLLVPTIEFSHNSMRILVSQHTDGSMIAQICKFLRMGLVRGSSSRGGMEAVREIMRPGRYRHIAVTPDGPRGPRRKLQPGVIYLASRLGWPIIAVGVGIDRPWRMRSWDQFAVPKPNHRAAFVASDPIVIPPDLKRQGMELYRRQVEDVMNALTETAERAALSGKKPRFDNPALNTRSDAAAA